jgi:DNA-binding PadR family transcriptional regulator
MALRHAILAALLDDEASGYELSKMFDVAVSDFWQASPQQIYAELGTLERARLVRGRRVRQRGRPDKRVFRITGEGRDELLAFSRRPPRASTIRDDLMVRLHAVEASDADAVIEQLRKRGEQARVKAEMFERLLAVMRGERDENTYLAEGARIGPYLTCLRGLLFEQENALSSEWAAALLEARRDGTEPPPVPDGLAPRR